MKTKIVSIEWLDSHSDFGWTAAKRVECLQIKSVGFLVCEDKESVTISTSYSSYGNVHTTMTIPKCAITKRSTIRHIQELFKK